MIQVSHLSKQYGPRAAVQDLNFEVSAGEVVGFLGPNGAGKSTTMKILTGFMPASEGRATVAGFDVFKQPIEVKRNVGYLPETPPVYLDMRVSDYIEYAARLHQVPSAQLKSACSSAIEKTNLGEVRGRLIGNLSKGYRQRVGLAQAIVHNPKVLILDEPTVGLDPKQIIEIRDLIKGLAGDHTVILSTHILPEVTATCQRIIVINRGKIVAQDTIENLTRGGKNILSLRNASESLAHEIRSLPGVTDATLSGNRIFIGIQPGSAEVRDKIVELAVTRGAGVLEFITERFSLEEIFLQLVTGDHQS